MSAPVSASTFPLLQQGARHVVAFTTDSSSLVKMTQTLKLLLSHWWNTVIWFWRRRLIPVDFSLKD